MLRKAGNFCSLEVINFTQAIEFFGIFQTICFTNVGFSIFFACLLLFFSLSMLWRMWLPLLWTLLFLAKIVAVVILVIVVVVAVALIVAIVVILPEDGPCRETWSGKKHKSVLLNFMKALLTGLTGWALFHCEDYYIVLLCVTSCIAFCKKKTGCFSVSANRIRLLFFSMVITMVILLTTAQCHSKIT